MTARPSPTSGGAPATAVAPRSTPSSRPTAALVIAAAGALLVGLGPLLGLVSAESSAAFTAWPALLVLALLPPALALALLRTGRSTAAAAVLVGAAALAPGRLALDVQFLVDAGLAARPELLRLEVIDAGAPGAGLWLLLAGHVAALVAGVLAAGERGDEETASGPLALGLLAGVLGAVGVLLTPFTSADPFLLPRAALDSPVAVLVGGLLLAVALPTTAAYAAGSGDREFARGGLLGLAAALAAVVLPPLIAVAALPTAGITTGPLLGLGAVVALVVLAWAPRRTADAGDDLRLPALTRLHRTAGLLALVAGVLAVVGALTPLLRMPAGLSDPTEYPGRMLWPAGLVLVAVGAALQLRSAERVRPVLAAVWAVVPMAAAGALGSVFAGLQVGARAGAGAWAVGLAVVPAAAAVVVAAVAGAVERDDVDLTEIAMRRAVLVPVLVALVPAAGAFAFPVLTAPGYAPPGIFTDFDTASWGLVVGLVAVVGAAVLAPMCRPPRAAALLAGAALVVAVRVAELPITAGRVDGSTPGVGTWCGLGAIVVLLVAAAVAGRRPEPGGTGADRTSRRL
ncbi:hypothetical protein [Saccharopolyspora sp. CA-218241]|uniref:hypothetical protein n=1 Tax=Saccharopolyspora sp. CA-218241 TaxID=3240027 RepID=UPI003D99BDA2